MPDFISATALAGGLAWASGIRLYMTLFMTGAFASMGWLKLPPTLDFLQSPWVLTVSGGLLVVEFLADKIPGFDSAWDALHTLIRIPAGAVLGAAALGQMDPAWTAVAGLLGGTLAAGSHLTKAGSRALINTSPEPFSNWAASFSEEAAVAGGLLAAFFHPWVLLTFLIVFFIAALWLMPKLWRGLRWLFRKLAT